MYVLIDMHRMVFLRKVDSHSAISKLAELEAAHVPTKILSADDARFASLTDYEIRVLIRNSSGPDVNNVFSRDTLTLALCSVIHHLPETKVNAFEVDLQLRAVLTKDGANGYDGDARYRYLPGSMIAQQVEGLEELALQYTGGDALPRPARPANVAPAATPAPAVQRAAGDDFVMPRDGTSTHTIFMFCAKLWKDSGFSEDKRVLDQIRKTAVDKLVPTGLNISTVRTQAARWYQHRSRLVL